MDAKNLAIVMCPNIMPVNQVMKNGNDIEVKALLDKHVEVVKVS
jgi:hypothetical protein